MAMKKVTQGLTYFGNLVLKKRESKQMIKQHEKLPSMQR